MSFPMVSIIMPTYNRQEFISSSIESILAQTYANWELIIIDDSSTDDTLNVIRSFKDQRIRVFENKKNMGVASSLNKAIELARGSYIARQDSDDSSLPERIEKQVGFLESHKEISICGSQMKSMFGQIIYNYPEFNDQIVASMLLSYPAASPTLMFRKAVFENLKFKEGLRTGEDYQWLAEAIFLYKMYTIQEVLVLYREHDDQLSIHYLDLQREADVNLRLELFKKLKYNINDYPDELILKFLSLKEPIRISEFVKYLKWLKFLSEANKSQRVFPQNELDVTLKKIKNDLLFKIFFYKSYQRCR
jgi:glycosyltransferase involved in cell wall biosynthesis